MILDKKVSLIRSVPVFLLTCFFMISGCSAVRSKDQVQYLYSVPISHSSGCMANIRRTSDRYADIVSFPQPEMWKENFDGYVKHLAALLGKTGRARGKRLGIYFMEDRGSPNAMALSPGVKKGQHYTILFGREMFERSIIERDLPSEDPGRFIVSHDTYIMAILAHEFAHVGQYATRTGLSSRSVDRELMADVISGWYVGFRATKGGSIKSLKRHRIKDIEDTINRVYRSGDYQFNHPDHHGTPAQRSEAFMWGVELARTGRALNFWDAFDIAAQRYIY